MAIKMVVQAKESDEGLTGHIIPSPSAKNWLGYEEEENKWYKWVNGEWVEITHTHSDLEDIVALLSNGITGSRTVQGYTLTFNHGVLVGFEPPA